MDEKLVKISLSIFIVIVFAFIGTYGWFMVFTERVCAININSAQCGQPYQTFLHNELSGW